MKRARATSLSLLWCCACVIGVGVVAGCDKGTDSSALEAGEWLPGGDTTNTLLLGINAFSQPASNIEVEHESMFFVGNSFFNQPWVQAPSSTTGRDGLGAIFNATSCSGCHFRDGRGRPPLAESEAFVSLLLRLSISGTAEHGAPLPDPIYGDQVQPFAIDDVPAEGAPTLSYTEITGTYDDGTPYTLLSPQYEIEELGYGALSENILISPRVAPAVSGVGLLEAIPLSRLQELEDELDDDDDGISGRINWVWDVEKGAIAAGRFGWKAEQPTLRQQAAAAFANDIGITSSLVTHDACTETQTVCVQAISGGAPEISDHLLDQVEAYMQLLAVPVRQNWDAPQVLKGKQLFTQAQCSSCHVSKHRTSKNAALPEISDQKIFPFTDLLLHDMGSGLADNRPTFGASGSEWRTPPLWGLRLYQAVNGHSRLLHDGRARGVAEAILWHGGEAQSAREIFRGMTQEQRDALIAYVESL